jgi:hypothetical protein
MRAAATRPRAPCSIGTRRCRRRWLPAPRRASVAFPRSTPARARLARPATAPAPSGRGSDTESSRPRLRPRCGRAGRVLSRQVERETRQGDLTKSPETSGATRCPSPPLLLFLVPWFPLSRARPSACPDRAGLGSGWARVHRKRRSPDSCGAKNADLLGSA